MTRFTEVLDENTINYKLWLDKYALKDSSHNSVENNYNNTLERVAMAASNVERKNNTSFYKDFLWCLSNGAIPSGRVLSNIGCNVFKLNNTICSSAVLQLGTDLSKEILESGKSLQSNLGVGYDFSYCKNDFEVEKMLKLFDSIGGNVNAAGFRKGAQIATMDCNHSCIKKFITSKYNIDELKNFNISVKFTNEFLDSISNFANNFNDNPISYNESVWYEFIISNYYNAEPGVVFIDRIYQGNNNKLFEEISGVNPCGEQPLPNYGSAVLGSIDISEFIKRPFTDNVEFDWIKFENVVKIFTRLVDNLIELNNLPLEKQRYEILRTRRHGIGILGVGTAITMLCLKYGSKDSQKFVSKVCQKLALVGYNIGIELAKEKGKAPILDEIFKCENGIKKKGSELFSSSSIILNKLNKIDNHVMDKFSQYGCRFTHHTSIAPTGSTSFIIADNASNGIEPSFSHAYVRNVSCQKTNSILSYQVLSKEYKLYLKQQGLEHCDTNYRKLPPYFLTADTIKVEDHVSIVAAAQEWIDGAISKTINVPTECSIKELSRLYILAYKSKLKGCTTFRYNPDRYNPVLERDAK
ncbi:ribonucleotide reductase N-terminal alpha domain-containing protein [Photobacterium damselae]|uniref:ribonucleotide reductase N-terminal alpha domain-containing protein n=1 Tax=Photobacterium damselae TaxID=38293 RepID=UPI001EFC5FE4|nr:ribonucleotide reductase N-terminal alpha domain-containing protein [Photobacterium damselae]MCG9780664.1 hypothetical protein [Photobacterium damselae]